MATHLAILHKRYLDAILEGRKTIESRLSSTRRAPFGCVRAGDVVYFKESGGPVRALARVTRVRSTSDLTPERIDSLRREHGGAIGAGRAYWASKQTSRYATLVWLKGAAALGEEASAIPVPRSMGHAWFVGERVRTTRA